MPQRKVYPCLPQHLLDSWKDDPVMNLGNSLIYSEDTEDIRFDIRTGKAPLNITMTTTDGLSQLAAYGLRSLVGPDVTCPSLFRFGPGDKKNWIHMAVHTLDVPLAYEGIRIGVEIDHKDASGMTPLLMCMEHIRLLTKSFTLITTMQLPAPLRGKLGKETLKNSLEQATRIAVLLVEQHADVDLGSDGRTPLSIAADLGRWDLVELLLLHGARPIPVNELSLSSQQTRLRYVSLVVKSSRMSARPARPCPCWSGKPLSQCHVLGKKTPLPPNFICICGAHKSFGNCCSKRNPQVSERWDAENNYFVLVVTTHSNKAIVPNDMSQAAEWQEGASIMAHMTEIIMNDPAKRRECFEINTFMKYKNDSLVEFMKDRPDREPAYIHANAKCDFYPRPWLNQISKIECKIRMEEWNSAVDEYIASGKDGRPRCEIERLAKIGADGGPLYKKCEAESCTKVEAHGSAKMKCCKKCKLIFYCGAECQKSDWRRHRRDCETRSHRYQLLPSQAAYEVYANSIPLMARKWAHDLKNVERDTDLSGDE